jgi:hypothetical protein
MTGSLESINNSENQRFVARPAFLLFALVFLIACTSKIKRDFAPDKYTFAPRPGKKSPGSDEIYLTKPGAVRPDLKSSPVFAWFAS